jgi:hypothetical protein
MKRFHLKKAKRFWKQETGKQAVILFDASPIRVGW